MKRSRKQEINLQVVVKTTSSKHLFGRGKLKKSIQTTRGNNVSASASRRNSFKNAVHRGEPGDRFTGSSKSPNCIPKEGNERRNLLRVKSWMKEKAKYASHETKVKTGCY